MVVSPITKQEAKLIEEIPCTLIEQQYRNEVQIDVSRYFKGLDSVGVYECQQTGQRFFFPEKIAGDAAFYEELQKFDWYYADWKWDYSTALSYIDNNAKVLDIGCGYGNFLKYIKNHNNCACAGLEFNDKAIKAGIANGLKIYGDTIQEHAKSHAGEYDIVCFFQVLEHITDVDSFLSASLKTLRKGGKLIICVPNNNPYWFRYFQYHSLNMPPHHMGMWNRQSFELLTEIYPINVLNIEEEELSRYRTYTSIFKKKRSGDNKFKKIFYGLATPFLLIWFTLNRKRIKAGSILAVYTKQ